MDETARSSLVPVTAGMHRAMMRVPSDRSCAKCGVGFPRYPGRYPSSCPKCGGQVVKGKLEAGGAVVGVGIGESRLPVVAVSRIPRLQAVIEAAVEGSQPVRPGPRCSSARFLSFEIVEQLLPGGVDGLRLFLEGPIPENENRYYRLESPDAPVLIFEFRPQASVLLLYASDDPVSSLGFDPRLELIEGGGEIQPGVGPPTPGDGVTRAVGGFRFEIGQGRKQKARKDVQRAIQNKINARRGLATRIQAARKWHAGNAGKALHADLGRFNKGNHRGDNVAKPLGEDNAHVRTVDDIFDGLIRKLITLEDLDIVQDVTFTDDGSIYFYIDPSIERDEIDAIIALFKQEHAHVALVGSPTGQLPGETGPADWWVIYVSKEALAPQLTPDMQGSGTTGATAPPLSYVKADDGVAHIAQQVDVGALIKAVANESSVSSDSVGLMFWSSTEDRTPKFQGLAAGVAGQKLPELCEAAARGDGTLFLIFARDPAAARDIIREGRLRSSGMNVVTNADDPRSSALIRAMGATTV